MATLLADLLRRHCSSPPKSLCFRAISPLFDHTPFVVCVLVAAGILPQDCLNITLSIDR
jgi:hydroxyacyl-ACP dehydratase HTD2-like protein with hotdog domain